MTAVEQPLTAGQVDVLRLVATGRTYREAAGELGISESTVKRRCANAATALGTHNITHTVAVALRCGLLEEEPPVPPEDEHPNLINIADGTEYKWVEDPPSGSGPGYANIDHHDWTWPREALERAEPVEDVRSLDSAELERLRRLR